MTIRRDNRSPEACVQMSWVECEEGIFEIDEFDCASIFLVRGTEKALLIDTGVGIGDLKWLVENKLTDLSYEVVATHNHGDHIGGAGWFNDIWIHPADADWSIGSAVPDLAFRQSYAELIRKRENKAYPYDPERDIRPWPKTPTFHPLQDGQKFDLGERTVTIYHCPGHTPGEIVLTDDLTGTLLCGDACNCNWLLSSELAPTIRECAERAELGLRRITAMAGQAYDPRKIYNFHHDFRPFGRPLSAEVMYDLETGLKELLNGTARFDLIPDALSDTGAMKTVSRSGSVMISCMGRDIQKEFES